MSRRSAVRFDFPRFEPQPLATLHQPRRFHFSVQAANAGVAPRQRSVSTFLKERRIGAQGREILEEQREIALFAENV